MYPYPIWMIKNFFFRSIVLIFILTSCRATQSETPIPTLELFDLYYSPALGYLNESISSCISSLGMIAPYLHERSTAYINLQSSDVLLTLGEANWEDKKYFATQIGNENIRFIVNAANPVETSDKNQLMDIFSGRKTIWQPESNTVRQINVWIYPDGSDLMDWLLDIFLAGNKLIAAAKLAPYPGAVLEAVSKDADAIGFIPESWLEDHDLQITNKIKILRVADSDEEEMSLPVLAYITNKPVGGIREFLLCMQEK